MAGLKSLYDEDFAAWSKQQAAALRAAARTGANQPLDWENLAEEIEALGKSERSALRSQIMRIIQHLTKLERSSSVEPRSGWKRSIRLARVQIQKGLEESPSLRRELGRMVREEMRRGIELAIGDLEEHEEIDEVGAAVLRRASYSSEQVLGDWFPEEPRG